MAVSCDTNDLAQLAKCFACLDFKTQMEVQTYLLALIANASTDPNTLAGLAKCFSCLDPKTLLEVKVYLLCQIVNSL